MPYNPFIFCTLPVLIFPCFKILHQKLLALCDYSNEVMYVVYASVYRILINIFQKILQRVYKELSCYSRFKEKARTSERESMQNFKMLYNTTSMLLCLLLYIAIHIAHDRKRKFLEQVERTTRTSTNC